MGQEAALDACVRRVLAVLARVCFLFFFSFFVFFGGVNSAWAKVEMKSYRPAAAGARAGLPDLARGLTPSGVRRPAGKARGRTRKQWPGERGSPRPQLRLLVVALGPVDHPGVPRDGDGAAEEACRRGRGVSGSADEGCGCAAARGCGAGGRAAVNGSGTGGRAGIGSWRSETSSAAKASANAERTRNGRGHATARGHAAARALRGGARPRPPASAKRRHWGRRYSRQSPRGLKRRLGTTPLAPWHGALSTLEPKWLRAFLYFLFVLRF